MKCFSNILIQVFVIAVLSVRFLHATDTESVEIPTEITETTNIVKTTLTATKSTLKPTAPLEFPKSTQDFPFKNNSKIREDLINKTNSEQSDLLKQIQEQSIDVITLKSIDNSKITVPDEDVGRKSDVEMIENGSDTEDAVVLAKFNKIEEADNAPYPVFKGQVAGILAGTFLLVSVCAYVALLSWRRYLERKYGSREMLCNEEDFVISHDDLRNFSI